MANLIDSRNEARDLFNGSKKSHVYIDYYQGQKLYFPDDRPITVNIAGTQLHSAVSVQRDCQGRHLLIQSNWDALAVKPVAANSVEIYLDKR